MHPITFNTPSLIILFGAAQGIFLSLYLLTRSENRPANKWLAFLLTAISLHLFEYGAAISGITLQYPFLMASTYPLLFCFGPFYFMYCRRLLDNNYRFRAKGLLHFIPALVVLLLMLPFYTLSADQKIAFMETVGSGDSLEIPAEQLIFMAAHVLQTIAYVYAAYRFVAQQGNAWKNVSSDGTAIRKVGWLKAFSLYFAAYLALYLVLVVVLTVIHSYQVQLDYILLLLMSLSVYAIGYSAIRSPGIFAGLPVAEMRKSEPGVRTQSPEPATGDRFPELKQQVLHYMEAHKPHLQSDLKISALAEALCVPSHRLSQLINDEFRVNFYDFINRYRVEDAKKLLTEDARELKILAIAYETGFNSKATFNRVFRKLTGLTPSEFREKYASSPANSETSGA